MTTFKVAQLKKQSYISLLVRRLDMSGTPSRTRNMYQALIIVKIRNFELIGQRYLEALRLIIGMRVYKDQK